jgi:hypothetical protein
MAAMLGRFQRRRLFATATVWCALALSSCAYLTGEQPALQPVAEPSPQPPVAVAKPVAPPRPIRKPSPPPLQQPGSPSATEGEPVDPEHLIGLDQRDAESWLGSPDQRTDAPPGTIWRYLSKDCQVDVYFYLDLQKGVMRALTYEVRSEDIVERRSERCFQQLVGEHRQRESNAASIGTH